MKQELSVATRGGDDEAGRLAGAGRREEQDGNGLDEGDLPLFEESEVQVGAGRADLLEFLHEVEILPFGESGVAVQHSGRNGRGWRS